jgi:DNA polymerase IV (DinB-like DNA polymerase)
MSIIIHVDLDYFYAQVEMKRKPELKDRPVIVCIYSGRGEYRGAVSTANYEARKMGIKSGMPIRTAINLAKNQGVFLSADREYYKQVSERIMRILEGFADSFEQVSIDEAYLDVTLKTKSNYKAAEKVASEIKERIKQKEGLICSVGVGPNKLVSKMAANMKKPDGLTVIEESNVTAFFDPLPVKKLFSVGPKTEDILLALGITTIGDLRRHSVKALVAELGERRAKQLHNFANGVDDRIVVSLDKQQISRLASLKDDTDEIKEITNSLKKLCEKVKQAAIDEGRRYKTVTLILITPEMRTVTKSKSFAENSQIDIEGAIVRMATDYMNENKIMVRRLGVKISNFYGQATPQKKLNQFNSSK